MSQCVYIYIYIYYAYIYIYTWGGAAGEGHPGGGQRRLAGRSRPWVCRVASYEISYGDLTVTSPTTLSDKYLSNKKQTCLARGMTLKGVVC